MSGPFLAARGLTRRYGGTTALAGVDLDLGEAETVAVVGASGSGKSTLVALLLALDTPDAGTVTCRGVPVRPGPVRRLRGYRRLVQAVAQDAGASLDPRSCVLDLVAEPLRRLGPALPGPARRERVLACLAAVELDPDVLGRRPAELSGGQAQRVAIARALATTPRLVIADEPTSSLDPPLRESVVDVLRAAARTGTGLLLVTHDLAVAAALCRRIVVLDAGRVVEDRPTADLLAAPEHPRTAALLDAVPRLPT